MNNKYISKYLLGEASQSETHALYEWLEQKEANRVNFLATKMKWEKTNSGEVDFRSLRGFDEIKKIYYRRKKNQRRITVSAIALVLCAVALLIMLGHQLKSSPVSLEFQNTPLALVINRIEDEYNIKIEVRDQDSLKCEFTGVFFNASPENLVRSIAKSKGLSTSRLNDKEFILRGQCL